MPTLLKIYYCICLEWGKELEGTVCAIVRALYGLKSSTNTWRTHVCTTLNKKIRFQSSYADNDFWTKKDTRPDGTHYHAYISVDVNNVFIISRDPSIYIGQLKNNYDVNLTVLGLPRFTSVLK